MLVSVICPHFHHNRFHSRMPSSHRSRTSTFITNRKYPPLKFLTTITMLSSSTTTIRYGFLLIRHPTLSSALSSAIVGRSFSPSLSSTRISSTAVRAIHTTTSDTLSKLLKDPSLLDPRWSSLSSTKNADISGPSFPVYDPSWSTSSEQQQQEEPIAIVSITPDPKAVIKQCYDALPSWRDGTTAYYRSSLLKEWSTHIQKNIDDLSTIMTMESGKPLPESRGEIIYSTSFLDYYAAEAIRPTGAGGGFLVPTPFAAVSGTGSATTPKGHIMAIQQSVGVAGLIVPWNFPMAMITRKVGPALAAGCTVVTKPSDLTPLSAIAVKNLATRAGIPPGIFELVMASPERTPDVGTEFCTNPLIRKISFTGSTKVGKLLLRQASDTVKRVSMELGGNACFVVFHDADIDEAVDAAMVSKFRNAGQTCVCSDRFLIHQSVYDVFVNKLAKRVEALIVGPGLQSTTQMGPLISVNAVESVRQKVETAIRNDGAILYCQPESPQDLQRRLGPHYYPPTILTNVSPDSDIWKTETFGPVVPIMSFDTEEEALAIANNVSVGLASYFCTKDLSRAFRFAHRLEVGIVGVNEGIISTTVAPFGGIKESGIGTEGSHLGLAEYLETKYVFMKT